MAKSTMWLGGLSTVFPALDYQWWPRGCFHYSFVYLMLHNVKNIFQTHPLRLMSEGPVTYTGTFHGVGPSGHDVGGLVTSRIIPQYGALKSVTP